jgi:hypothetical protein
LKEKYLNFLSFTHVISLDSSSLTFEASQTIWR